MSNPFLSVSEIDKTEYPSPRCSLNRAVLAKLPLYGVDDSIEGLPFKKIISTPAIVAETRRVARRYGVDVSGIPDGELPMRLEDALLSGDILRRQVAERVVNRFGNRLGLLLLTLRTGERENRLARPEWDGVCWDYWRDIRTVILTGGLASSMLGRRFKECIQTVFDTAGVKPYDIRLFDNGSYVGVMGLAQRLLPDDAAAPVFDMGHTGWKRALVRKSGGEIIGFSPMESLPSLYMQSVFDTQEAKRATAGELNKYIVNTVASSFREAAQICEVGSDVLVSIANYTHGGILNDRHGGYAKLTLLGENYAQVLSEELSGELHRRMRVRLVHDATATALYFADVERSVCITLGTGFGVGFPEIHI